MIVQMSSATGWVEDHTVTTICNTPIYKDTNITKRCLMISVWKKLLAPTNIQLPKPFENIWCDTHVEDKWTKQNNEPLQGKSHFLTNKS